MVWAPNRVVSGKLVIEFLPRPLQPSGQMLDDFESSTWPVGPRLRLSDMPEGRSETGRCLSLIGHRARHPLHHRDTALKLLGDLEHAHALRPEFSNAGFSLW